MQSDPHNPNQSEETQVLFFKKNPQPPNKSSLKWLWYLVAILVLFYLLQHTENYALTLAASMVLVFAFRWRKILDEINEQIKTRGVKHATGTVIGTLLMKILLYAIGISFLLTITVPLACDVQKTIGIKFFSNKLCEKSFINFENQLDENKY